MSATVVVPDAVRDGSLTVVASVSGGKDSTALILALREAEVPARYVFADTQWEAPETYAYLDTLRTILGITIDVVGRPGGMPAAIRAHRGFTPGMNKWCSRELKHAPIRAYHERIADEEGISTVAATGQRAEESAARAKLATFAYEPKDRQTFWRAILGWSLRDVLDIHHRYGVPVNPLYKRNHSRVGCYPCVKADVKAEINAVATHMPDRIALIRDLEAEVASVRAETPGAESASTAFFFRDTPIDRAVAWARTSHGGVRLTLWPEEPSGGCGAWGLCEPPSKDDPEAA